MEKSSYHVSNIVAFYVIWLWTMVTVSKEWMFLGPAVSLLIICAQVAWVHREDPNLHLPSLARFAGLILMVGLISDSALMHFDFFKFAANPLRNITSPPWMMILWMEFAICFYISGRYFFTHYWQAGLLALVGSSLFYSAMGEFGAIFLYDRVFDTVIIGVLWAILLPACLYVNGFFSSD